MGRDAEHDWEIIAKRDPYFGVLSTPDFRAGAIDAETLRKFYQYGENDVASLLAWFEQDVGARPSSGRALDIGCGVGRLTRAIARVMPAVVGYDIAESMLAIARKESPPNADYVATLPDGPFAWICSYIVFQHIRPNEGLKLLDDALYRASPDCFLSLQITFWTDYPPPKRNILARLRRGLIRNASRKAQGDAARLIQMHTYSMNEVMRRLTAAGFTRVVVRHTNHNGSHGAWLMARRG